MPNKIFEFTSGTNQSTDQAVDDSEHPWFVPLSTPASSGSEPRLGTTKYFRIPRDDNIRLEVFPLDNTSAFTFRRLTIPESEVELSGLLPSRGIRSLRARRVIKKPDGTSEFASDWIDELKVLVLPHYPLTISFFNVIGEDYTKKWNYLRREECIEIIKGVNAILQPQCGLWFTLKYCGFKIVSGMEESVGRYVRFDKPIGLRSPLKYYSFGKTDIGAPKQCVMGRPPGPLGCDPEDPALGRVKDVKSRRRYRQWNLEQNLLTTPNSGDFEVYIVERTETLDPPGANAWYLGDRKVLMPQDLSYSIVLAHEIGHWLFRYASDRSDIGGHNPRKGNLMNTRVHADQIRFPEWHLTRHQIEAAIKLLDAYIGRRPRERR
jgi:hypothetical protein